MTDNPLLSDQTAGATAPPVATSAAGSPAPPAATVAGAAASPGATPPQGAASGASSPAGETPASIFGADLPEALRGASDAETAANLARALKGYRDRDATRGETPKEAKGYVFDAPAAVKPYVADIDNDPIFAKAQGLAHEHGMTTKQFNAFLGGVMQEMIDKGMMPPAYDPDAVRAQLAPDVTDPRQRAVKVDGMVREAQATVKAFEARGLPKAETDWLMSQLGEAAPIRLVHWLAKQGGGPQPALAGQAQGAVTEADLNRMMADPRGKVGSSTYDAAFVAQRDEAFKAVYGTAARA